MITPATVRLPIRHAFGVGDGRTLSVVNDMPRKSPVIFIGEIDERQKTKFLGEAAALLFPVDWPEPFGLVMIEAMACGTPVLAFRCGSVPEVIEDGVTGKVVDSEEEAIGALPAILAYDRRAVRQRFEERFTATRMAQDYVSTYRLMKTRTSGAR